MIVALHLVSDESKTVDWLLPPPRLIMMIDDAAVLFVIEHNNKAQFCQDRTSFCEGDISAPRRFIIVRPLEDILVDNDDGTNRMHSAPSWSTLR